ncbi:MAG TPA: AbrB/MazE/SpoVT family DNA-binding domain-containing protein [Candidatus Limnocylindria bacterium]|nr:AbrB/MazE/SpoVT family DNA-binding domain-containing protein [Candidatus Limnocylindria bacterium]
MRVRDRNQITLPARVAARLGAKVGDTLVVTVPDGTPPRAELRPVLRSYAGVAGDLYGATPEERMAYVAEERASWGDADAGAAADGTPYLTFEQSKRVYWQTEVTPERYAREPKLRWQKCDLPGCRRSIAKMREHRAAHASGLLDERGDRTDAAQVARTRSRVAKWRRSIRHTSERAR